VVSAGANWLPIGQRTIVMGIVNVTPDSFSDGGRFSNLDAALAHCMQLLEDGADVLDIGGESTRPGAQPVSVDDEIARVVPLVNALVARGVRNISVDTRNAKTARHAIGDGACWLNDVSALQHDPEMLDVARHAEAVVLMHARAMDAAPEDAVSYEDVVEEVAYFLEQRVAFAEAHGVKRERIIVDPGIGFGKSLADNLALTRALGRFSSIGAAVLYGPSRKRFLGTLAREDDASRRDAATHGAVAYAAEHGADIVRVHDVKGCVQALAVVDALRGVSR
jgi:dihydropteroate synthase